MYKALGFDCEWANVKDAPNPVSLLQLASPSGRCVLVRLNMFEEVPATLRSMLSDKGWVNSNVPKGTVSVSACFLFFVSCVSKGNEHIRNEFVPFVRLES